MKTLRRFTLVSLALFLVASCAWATVSTTTNKTIFTGNGSTKIFTWAFPVIAAGDVQVVTVDGGVETVVSSGITVAVNTAKTGGTVTFATAPASGLTIVIRRAVSGTQNLNLTPSQRLNVESLETAYDRAALWHNDQAEQLARTPKLAAGSSTTGLILPEPEDGKYVGWSGTQLANLEGGGSGSSISVSSYVDTLLDKSSASQFLAGLDITDTWNTLLRGYDSNSAILGSLGISSNSQSLLAETTDAAFLAALGGSSLGQQILAAETGSDVRNLIAAAASGYTQASIPLGSGGLMGLSTALASYTSVIVYPGAARDRNDTVNLSLAPYMIKTITATWDTGDGNGGMYNCTAKANTWYYVAVVGDGVAASDVIFYTATTGTAVPMNGAVISGPTGYEKYRRVGSFYLDAASLIKIFTQIGDVFIWYAPVMDYSSALGSTSAVAITLASCPTYIGMRPTVRATLNINGAIGLITTSDQGAPSTTAAPGFNVASLGYGSNELTLMPTDGTISARTNNASAVLRIITVGWVDRRGQDGYY